MYEFANSALHVGFYKPNYIDVPKLYALEYSYINIESLETEDILFSLMFVCECTTCMAGDNRGQNKSMYPLRLELR